jgi:hypothetical protein
MDLLTVVSHELAHVLGFASVDPALLPHDLMTATLAPGVRRTAPETLPSPSFAVTPGSVSDAGIEQYGSNVVAFVPTLAPGTMSPAADGLDPVWLLVNGTQAGNGDLWQESATAALTRYEMPGRSSWLNPQPPTLLVNSADLTPGITPPLGDSPLSPASTMAGQDPVLVGGEGEDLVVGNAGRDVLVGGIGNLQEPAVGPVAAESYDAAFGPAA